MKPEIKKLIIKMLNEKLGDDLYRAECSFKNCTYEQMNSEYGNSGRTRNEILKRYQDHDNKINEAIKAVEAL